MARGKPAGKRRNFAANGQNRKGEYFRQIPTAYRTHYRTPAPHDGRRRGARKLRWLSKLLHTHETEKRQRRPFATSYTGRIATGTVLPETSLVPMDSWKSITHTL